MTTQYFPLFALKNIPMDVISMLINTKAGAKPIYDHASLAGSWLADRVAGFTSEDIKLMDDLMNKGMDRQGKWHILWIWT